LNDWIAFRGLPLTLIEMTKVVRPPQIAGGEILRVEIRRLGGLVVLRRLQDHPQLPVRRAQVRIADTLRARLDNRGVALLDLVLDGCVEAREIGQRDVAQRLRRGRGGLGFGARGSD
jgi:hypothetical protein